MSFDLIGGQSPPPTFYVEPPIGAVRVCDASSQLVCRHLPQDVITGVPADTIEALLLSVARGDQEAFVALQSHIAGLVRVNVRRVLRDASRTEAVTQETFAEVLEHAISFDPHRDNALTWLLTRAHQRANDELSSQAMDEPRSVDATHDPRAATIDQA